MKIVPILSFPPDYEYSGQAKKAVLSLQHPIWPNKKRTGKEKKPRIHGI